MRSTGVAVTSAAPAGEDVVNPNTSSLAVRRGTGGVWAACGAGATRIGDTGFKS